MTFCGFNNIEMASFVNNRPHQHLVTSADAQSASCSQQHSGFGVPCQISLRGIHVQGNFSSCNAEVLMPKTECATSEIFFVCSSAPGWTLQWMTQRAARNSLSVRQVPNKPCTCSTLTSYIHCCKLRSAGYGQSKIRVQ